MAYCLYVFLLETQKEPKRSPLLPIAREARPRGCSPLGTPKLWSRIKKAKPCRSAARFLTLFCFSPSGPSGANFMEVEEFWPQRGQSGKRKKSVKKNAALLHFLGFFPLTLLFGVLRGEQPLRRGPLPRNSGIFFATFFGHKKGRPNGAIHYKRPCRKVGRADKERIKISKES